MDSCNRSNNTSDMDHLMDTFMDDAFTKIIDILKPGSEGLTMGEKIIQMCQASFMVGVVAGMAHSK